jgi:hypothetical protein
VYLLSSGDNIPLVGWAVRTKNAIGKIRGLPIRRGAECEHEEELFARIETALKLKHTVDRKIGELRALKDHFAKLVRLVTTPDAFSS